MLNTGWSKTAKVSPEEHARSQANDRARGFTTEAVTRFAQRYPERFLLKDGKPVGAIPRLRLVLQLIREGKFLREESARSGLIQEGDYNPTRRIFEVEMPADVSSPVPYVVRFMTDKDLQVIITVLPLASRKEIRETARHQKRKQNRVVDEVTETEMAAEKVELPPPVKVCNTMAEVFRKAGIAR